MLVYDVTCEKSFHGIKDWLHIVKTVSNLVNFSPTKLSLFVVSCIFQTFLLFVDGIEGC